MELTRQQKYERKSVSALRFYAGLRGLGVRPVDVEGYLGKRVGVYQLTKVELVQLHLKLDEAGCGLGDNLS